MEENQVSPKSTIYNYGLFYALLSIAILIVLYVMNLEKSIILSVINVLGSIAILFLGIREYKLKNHNQISLGKAIKVGLGIALIGGIIAGIYSYFHYIYLVPEFIENIRNKGLEDIYSNPDLNKEQIESAKSMMDIFTSPMFFATITVLGSLFYGLIVSLISGLILKNT
ncbi:MAG: DUF4199 domain-containing protein [Mesoflavibacter sp.]|nr:DUF4199 domain-containing protein [Mesoflavibacter sp.]